MYVIIWEFRVKKGQEQEFEKAYGSTGDWANFFKQERGYRQTRLLHDLNDAGTYLTMDYWDSQNDFELFKQKMKSEYEQMDKRFEALTEREKYIGSFSLTDDKN